MKRLSVLLAVLFSLSILLSACGPGGGGMPPPGSYSVQKNSVHFDGERYDLFYADQSGNLHRLETRRLRLVRDPERSYLEVPSGGDPILHLREDEPILVEGRDREGGFTSSWFPFLIGAALGSQFGGGGRGPVIINQPAPGERGSYDASAPAYRYPPTGTFGRNDSLHGTLDSSKPETPDYSRVQPQPYATSGKSSGTGGGTAASNKGTFSKSGGDTAGKPSTGAQTGGGSRPSTGVSGGGAGSGGGGKGISGARSGGRR